MVEATRAVEQKSAIFPWYALKVRTSGEQKVCQALEHKVSEAFLPTFMESRRYSDRIKTVEAALFPGYLFARLDIEHRLPVLQTPGVEAIVGFGGEFEPVKEEEIGAIRIVLVSGAQVVPWPYLKDGDRVRVQFGAFEGIDGILLKVKGQDRLILSINMLQRSVSVEIDRSWVRPIGR